MKEFWNDRFNQKSYVYGKNEGEFHKGKGWVIRSVDQKRA